MIVVVMIRALLYVYSNMDMCQNTSYSLSLSYSILDHIEMADLTDVVY